VFDKTKKVEQVEE